MCFKVVFVKLQMLLSANFMVRDLRRTAFRFLSGVRDFSIRNVKTSPVLYRVSYSVGTGGSFS